jgi:hypothetical protein
MNNVTCFFTRRPYKETRVTSASWAKHVAERVKEANRAMEYGSFCRLAKALEVEE